MSRDEPTAKSGKRHGFNMMDRSEAERLGVNVASGMPLAMRIYFLACKRINNTGHAGFDQGELVDLLVRVNPTTGEMIETSGQGVDKAIKTAASWGIISPRSNRRCIVIPTYQMEYFPDVAARDTCKHHRS